MADPLLATLEEEQTKPLPDNALLEILALDTTWPLHDVLAQLVEATEHTLRDHNCDHEKHST